MRASVSFIVREKFKSFENVGIIFYVITDVEILYFLNR